MAQCPVPPAWGPYLSRPPRALWKQANIAIENAYRDDKDKQGHAVLFGSQFEEGFIQRGILREIRLPEKTSNKEFANVLLNELRGPRGGPRKPDIVDFTDRAFYEIKTTWAFANLRNEVINQHQSLYRMADRIVRDFNQAKRDATAPGGRLAIQDDWGMGNADWTPPKCLDVPGYFDQFKIFVYRGDILADAACRGIIVYQLWQRYRRKEEERQSAVNVVVEDQDQQYDNLIPSPAILPKAVGKYNADQPEHLIIVPKYFDDAYRKRPVIDIVPAKPASPAPKQPAQPSIFSRVKTFATEHPYITAGAILVVAATGVAICVVAASGAAAVTGTVIAVEEGAAAAGTAAAVEAGTAAAVEQGGSLISLAARQLAAKAAGEAAKRAAGEMTRRAAGIIFIMGTVGKVSGNTVSFSKIGFGRAIALGSVAPYRGTNSALSSGLPIADSPDTLVCSPDNIGVGDQVMFDSEAHSVVATLTAYPNNLSSLE